MKPRLAAFVLVFVSVGLGCSSKVDSATVAEDAALDTSPADTSTADVVDTTDAPVDAPMDADKAAMCASTFGTALTASFGRIDGTVVAVVPPTNMTCAMPNGTHVVVQVKMGGDVYRMVVNVQSDRGTDLDVRTQTIDHALIGVPWSEGWHTGSGVDYATALGVHSTSGFVPVKMDALVTKITDAIEVGAPISVYATSSGGASAHLVHRNGGGSDGAIVLDPKGSPKWMLFHFADQTF